MAPALVDPPTEIERSDINYTKSGTGEYKVPFSGPKAYSKELELKGTDKHAGSSYPNYLPTWPSKTYPPLEPFEHYDHGKDADASFKNLFGADAKVADLTANIGAEVHGVQLSKLNQQGKDELARFVAEKKVVAFRDQDFADLPIQEALDFGGYFGRHHIHPTSGGPEGHPEIHLVHRGTDDTTARDFFEERTNSITWHSDVTYEKQPPGTTFLYLLDGPLAGGDTLFANQAAAYRRLSPEFQKRLHGLKAVHSGIEQAENSRNRGGIVRREPVTSVHPLVRTHPVTGEKALFVNPQFTRRIIGYKKEESDFLLNFLYDHIAKGQDFQARVKWAPKTVVVWDNRVTAHSALLDWDDGARRHLARITPQAERPYETPFE
ncbi:TauD-domain-containing protein [Aaosphaeria arxii CBS 175.79]|uniref:TauD-domain-containing protein n=1 Tax=Aaosphaeria arxii CBS 175.79 TaxID=1450172 RepID=A0A6A5XU69_9PLEO|nr:TauD-domain-containing protein [Aaosphaeria arxii CBS 175.79]KAF2016905.1 TauD-domain-containing protein [Aaosphaeria arxii CBS 175.79]